MVTLQVLDQKLGHLELELAPQEALNRLGQFNDESKWLFVDGQPKNFSGLSVLDIQEASLIQVTEQLQEG